MVTMKTAMLVTFLVIAPTAAVAVCGEQPCLVTVASGEYTSAKTPADKSSVVLNFRRRIEDAAAAHLTPKKAAELTDSCLILCRNESINCGQLQKTDPNCVAPCQNTCRAEVKTLSIGNELYTQSSVRDRDIVAAAIRSAEDMIEELSLRCLGACPIGAAGYNCLDACAEKYVTFYFAMITPSKRDAIFKDVLEQTSLENAIEEEEEREQDGYAPPHG